MRYAFILKNFDYIYMLAEVEVKKEEKIKIKINKIEFIKPKPYELFILPKEVLKIIREKGKEKKIDIEKYEKVIDLTGRLEKITEESIKEKIKDIIKEEICKKGKKNT